MREMIAAFRKDRHVVETLIIGGDRLTISPHDSVRPRLLKAVAKSMMPSMMWETLKHRQRISLDITYGQRLEQRIEEFQPDLIYERSAYLQRSGVDTANRFGVPHVLEINTPVNAERSYLGQANSCFESRAEETEKHQLQTTNLAAVVSPAMIEYFVDKYAIASSKIICTPNGVDLNGSTVDELVVKRVKQHYKLDGKFVVGFVGCMAQWQRVDLLLSAIATLAPSCPQIVALLVGGVDNKILELKRQAKRLGIADQVHFPGSVPQLEVASYISAMDACVLPDNLWYGSPTKLFEYAALKRPTIAPDNVTLRSIIQHGVHGLLVPGEAHALAAAIHKIVEDTVSATAMGEAFYNRVSSEFTWAANVKRILKTLGLDHPANCDESAEL